MERICLISYYGAIESIGLAKKALEKNELEVYDFPLYKYMHDQYDKRENYVDMLIEFIKNNKIKYVLWWYINIQTSEFKIIKDSTNVKYLFFNWDEPYNWPHCDIINKMSYMDNVFVTCQETLCIYEKNGCKTADCLYAGYDPTINYIITDMDSEDFNNYSCDISFCCTNLYEDINKYPEQYINRKEIIDTIYNGQKDYNYKFYIYGPSEFAKLYPESYKGFAKYENLNKIFNYSKINLCTHVLDNKYGYLNERIILIGGSGGLVFVDPVRGIENIFTPNQHIIVINKHNYLTQIAEILSNYDKYIDIRISFNKICSEKYTYEKWAEVINRQIKNTI